jgi:hypothetical protein
MWAAYAAEELERHLRTLTAEEARLVSAALEKVTGSTCAERRGTPLPPPPPARSGAGDPWVARPGFEPTGGSARYLHRGHHPVVLVIEDVAVEDEPAGVVGEGEADDDATVRR